VSGTCEVTFGVAGRGGKGRGGARQSRNGGVATDAPGLAVTDSRLKFGVAQISCRDDLASRAAPCNRRTARPRRVGGTARRGCRSCRKAAASTPEPGGSETASLRGSGLDELGPVVALRVVFAPAGAPRSPVAEGVA
jgi:hypothetical protein